MWRVDCQELLDYGFDVPSSADEVKPTYLADLLDITQAHVNILEFVAIGINLWLLLIQL